MPTRAKITIWGLFEADEHLFDGFYVPDGVTPDPGANPPIIGYDGMDTGTAVFTIMQTCGQLECMYPDPEFMKPAIQLWTDINFNKWQRLWDSENLHYNPIYNVDATEVEDRNLKYERDLNYTRDDKNKYSGFNSSTLNDVTQQYDADRDAGYTNDTGTVTKTRYGNIGVTMTQQMIEAERQVADFSTYKVIAEDFKKEFCVMVY